MGKRILALAVALALSPAGARSGPGQGSAEILYRFKGGRDGGGPFGAVVRDRQGNLFGATAAGGKRDCNSPIDAPGCGVVYELSAPANGQGAWQEAVLYTFVGGADGNGPLSPLLLDGHGNLFGTTEAGGAGTGACANGCGTVFELSPPTGGNTSWTETVLHRFGATDTDGEFPAGAMLEDSKGNIYGTTSSGGNAGLGTVFEMSPRGGGKWIETILHDFQTADGSVPVAGLLLGTGGTLFGTTESGRTGGKLCKALGECGTVFSLSPPAPGSSKWPFAVLFRFPGNGDDGLYPMGTLVQDPEGMLIGTASNFGITHGKQANGTVFRLSPPAQAGQPWVLHTLLYFTTIGAYPDAPVLQGHHHILYGTTSQAGSGIKGNGLVYALAPTSPGSQSWQETPLFSFPATGDGAFPVAGVVADGQGHLVGTASTGGSANCKVPFCGTVFRVTSPK